MQINLFEDGAHAGLNREWEIKEIKDAVLFIALIFDDSDEVKYEIEQAINLKNPVLLFFFPNKTCAEKTWAEFAESKRIKSKEAPTWNDLIESIRKSIDNWIIGLSNENKGKANYEPPQTMENI